MATTLQTIINRARVQILEALALFKPIAPLVAPQGTTGATTYAYKVVARNATGHSEVSEAGSTTTGNATLSGTNFNRLNWANVPRALTYDVYRTSGGTTQGKIASGLTSPTLDDTGLAGDATTASTDNTSGTLGTSQHWSDAELLDWAIAGAKDMWRTIIDLHQSHFVTFDESNVSHASGTRNLTGVPSDVFRVLLIEPRDTSDSSNTGGVKYRPAPHNSHEFRRSRARGTVDPNDGYTILYDIINAGSPVAAPTIVCAPMLSSALLLRMEYIPTLALSATTDNNPIPGESDHALMAFVVANALVKDREDKSPDPNWIGVYRTEKDSIMIASAPRQEQEPQVVPGIFDDLYDLDGI